MRLSSFVIAASLLLQGPTFSQANDLHYSDPDEADVPYIEMTKAPTHSPTTSPSGKPTTTPTASPSHSPTPYPTAHPSPHPTFAPTASPSSSPTLEPSKNPTPSPSHSPTKSPSGSPTFSPSNAPSDMPSLVPSQAPSKADCQASEGVFGSVGQNADAQIKFSYDLEVKASKTNDYIENQILPDLESGIVNVILPTVFQDDCGHSLVRRNLRIRRLEISAVSKYPEDEIYEDVQCTTVGDGNTCVVVKGEMTFFADDEIEIFEQTEAIQNLVKDQMEAGSLNDAHADIVSVSYRDIDPDENKSESNTPDNANDTPGNDTLNAYPFIIGAAALVVVVVGVAYQRRRRNSDESDATNTQIGIQAAEDAPVAEPEFVDGEVRL